jgi:KUP system potassium uptake protein
MFDDTQDCARMAALALGALGVVYGDIGTSPLYALRECFHGSHAIEVSRGNVLGVLSLILWSLILLVSIKYLTLVVRADNKGEGGILALLTLGFPEHDANRKRWFSIIILIGVFGTALLYGDGVITPAISVLSAVEGLNVATKFFEPYIIPITLVILIALFLPQRFGTGKIGNVFGRVTLAWFIALALLGLKGIVSAPAVLSAINPVHAVRFFLENGGKGFVVLGAVFLAVTGAEALYADLGHFGRAAIRRAWFAIVLPALVLNYFGQGALLLHTPSAAENPFYLLAPRWALFPLVALAAAATVIASQALISGAFSLTMHAVQLGYFPRLTIEHTSSMERGQIYIPFVNWVLMFACIGLVAGFKSSSNLAAAYGIAVTMTMLITTVLFGFVAVRLWRWNRLVAIAVCLPFFLVELAFFGANALKITHGGWFPLAMGAVVFVLLTTWKTGRRLLAEKAEPFHAAHLAVVPGHLQPSTPQGAWHRHLSCWKIGQRAPRVAAQYQAQQVLHERVIFLTVISHEHPHIEEQHRVEVEQLQAGFYRVVGHYGFMEEPNVPRLLEKCRTGGLDLNPQQCTYFLSRENLIPTRGVGMAYWREVLFTMMSRNATSAAAFFKLPPNQVVELGMQIEL